MMGTLGKRWKLKPSVRKHRGALITKVWASKTFEEKEQIRLKKLPGLKRARQAQAKSGRAPETSRKIRSRISRTMKKIRKNTPVFNLGVIGYTNRGSFPKGHRPAIAGSPLISHWILAHNDSVRRMAAKFSEAGLKVWTCFDGIPDLIVRDGNRLLAYEVTGRHEGAFRMLKRRKHQNGFFDEVIWTDLKGRKR